MSLAFLNQKGFHPQNFHNQRKLWMAEEKQREDAKRQEERQRELKAEEVLLLPPKHREAIQSQKAVCSQEERRNQNLLYANRNKGKKGAKQVEGLAVHCLVMVLDRVCSVSTVETVQRRGALASQCLRVSRKLLRW